MPTKKQDSKENEKTVLLSLDVGNGFVKAKYGPSDKEEFIITSALLPKSAIGEDVLGPNLTSSFEYNVYKSVSSNDGNEYLWGPALRDPSFARPSDLLETINSYGRYNKKYYKLLIDFALAELGSHFGQNVNALITTGMPSNEINTASHKMLEETFLGKHEVKRDDKFYVVDVNEIKIFPQPLGTLVDHFSNDEGFLDDKFTKGRVIIFDFGNGTTIIDVYVNGRRIASESTVINRGLKWVFKTVADKMSKDENAVISPTHIQAAVEAKEKTLNLYADVEFDYKPYFDSAMQDLIDYVVNIGSQIIGNPTSWDAFGITGGGSPSAKASLIKQLGVDKSRFFIPKKPQVSSVRGFYKLGLPLLDKFNK